MSIGSQLLISALWDFPWTHFLWPCSTSRTDTPSYRVTFQQSCWPLFLLLPDPQEINEYVALRWPLCISTHQKQRRQVARVQDDRKTIPPFISQLQPPTSLPPEQDGETPGRKGWRASAPRWQGITKSSCHWVREKVQKKDNRLYSSSNLFILTV